MKISACLIVRDEEKNLERCLQSVRPFVDELCILDTGSTDRSPEIAQKYADKFEVWTGCNGPDGKIRDFSAARNRNLEQATGDVLLWVDGDDELVGGEHLRKLVSEAPQGSWAYLAPYEYDTDEAGRVVTLQWRERLVYPRSGFEWRGPVHEGLLGKAGTTPQHLQTDAILVKHRRKQAGKPADPERNLRILREWFRANGEADVRLMHYFGAELLLNRHIGESMYWLRRHAAMSNWCDERCLSLLHLARIHLAMGDGGEAARYATEAMTTKRWPEPLWLMGQAFCTLADQGIDEDYNLRRGGSFLEQGMKLGDAPTLLMTDPTQRFEACHWLSIVKFKLGDLAGAIASAEEGLRGMPEHDGMQRNLREWKVERAKHQARAAMVELHQLGAVQREAGVMVESALNGTFRVERALPKKAEPITPLSQERIARALYGDGPEPLRIAFWLGHQLEPWTPETLERDGMGGSETMAWEISKRLAKMEHEVYVFGHIDRLGPRREYEGVEWRDAEDFQMYMEAWDVLIVSRQAAAVTLPHSANTRVLWVHDVHCGPDLTPAIAAQYDLIWCLSNWHRDFFLQTYPWMPPAKVEVTRNGIDLARFSRTDIKRNPHRAVYSSSPDRGLAEAVRAWPEVRKRVPDAELHCFYGWENWERSLQLGGENGIPHCSRAALDELKQLVATTEGVFMHGRVNGKRLAEEMLASGVWFYPTWFSETSCITAMEAQAAGLWCVCPLTAALAETVPQSARCWDVDGDPVKAICWGFRLARKGERTEAYDVSLDTLATDWDKRLRSLVDAVVPAFSEAAQ